MVNLQGCLCLAILLCENSKARVFARGYSANSRLVSMAHGKVIFGWWDYAHGQQARTMTLEVDEFLRRFLLHVLPPGFVRIRYFGVLANRHRTLLLNLCREYLQARLP